MKVIDCQPTQFTQSQPNLGGQACHHVRARRGQPFPKRGQLVTPGSKEGGQVLRRRWYPNLEVTGMARSVAIIDRRRDDPASQLPYLARVAQFQEPEEQIDRASFPPTSRHSSPSLLTTQEPIRMGRFDLPHPHASSGQELLDSACLEPNRAVSNTMGQTRQNVLRQQVFLIPRCLVRILHRARGSEISDDTQQCDPSPARVHESRIASLITDERSRLRADRRDFPLRSRFASPPRLTRHDHPPGEITARANLQKIQFKFTASDEPQALHDHPWWFASLVLSGSYIEHSSCGRRRRRRGSVALRASSFRHRIELPVGPEGRPRVCRTLVVTGPRVRGWGFWCGGDRFVPWDQFDGGCGEEQR